MSKHKKQKQQRRTTHQPKRQQLELSLSERIVDRILRLPRLLRILFIGFLSLCMTLAIGLPFYIADNRFLLSPDGESITTAMLVPFVVSVMVGFIAYGLGWRWIVDSYELTTKVRNRVLWYLVVGGGALIIDLIWWMNVVSSSNQPL